MAQTTFRVSPTAWSTGQLLSVSDTLTTVDVACQRGVPGSPGYTGRTTGADGAVRLVEGAVGLVEGSVGLCEQPMSERAVRAIMTNVLIVCLGQG